MAKSTEKSIRNLVIYEIYVRNHGQNGNFADVSADLPRIKAMGVDVIWFMPIHPIGEERRKGTLGCPYAIRDYREVNEEYGTREEFRMLVQYAHALGLKVMIDVVFHHCAPDNVLIDAHPEWVKRDEDGRSITTVPDWSDVVDLDFSHDDLWDYLMDCLKLWVNLGVDGFRCDVASLVPLEFWLRARQEIEEINPDVIWLAESTHVEFLLKNRAIGKAGASDGELYAAFDLTYDHDIWPLWQEAVLDETAVPLYFSILKLQKGLYPDHAIKMRCVENHDQVRIMQRAPSRAQAMAWTAFQVFNEGAFLIYAGQESETKHTPSLFEVDKINWQSYSLQIFLTRLCQLIKHPLIGEGRFELVTHSPLLTAVYQTSTQTLYGVFNVQGAADVMDTPLPDGRYVNLLSELDEEIEVRGGEMMMPETAVVVQVDQTLPLHKFRQPSTLM